jgi:hypothetical protein
MIRRLLRRLLPFRYASGGTLPPYTPRGDEQLVILSPGREITDPDEAEALGLTADAQRMRRRNGWR